MRERGFSLIELMVVLAIIAIISAYAIPSYTQYLVKASRRATQAFLLDVHSAQRQYFIDARNFATTLGTLGFTSIPDDVASQYDIQLVKPADPDAACFYLKATPKAGTRQEGEPNLYLNSIGVRRQSMVDPDSDLTECAGVLEFSWADPATATAWDVGQ